MKGTIFLQIGGTFCQNGTTFVAEFWLFTEMVPLLFVVLYFSPIVPFLLQKLCRFPKWYLFGELNPLNPLGDESFCMSLFEYSPQKWPNSHSQKLFLSYGTTVCYQDVLQLPVPVNTLHTINLNAKSHNLL